MSRRINRFPDPHTVGDFDGLVPELDGVARRARTLELKLEREPPTLERVAEARHVIKKYTVLEDIYEDLRAIAGASLRGTNREDTFIYAREAIGHASRAVRGLEAALSHANIDALIAGRAAAIEGSYRAFNPLGLPEAAIKALAWSKAKAIARGETS